jgi:putative chitinase
MAYGADVNRVTRIINGGLNGIDDRKIRYNKARAALLV